MTSRGLPTARTSVALAVTDGHNTIGYVIEHDGSYFAYGADQILIGEFKTRREAVRAIPSVSPSGA